MDGRMDIPFIALKYKIFFCRSLFFHEDIVFTGPSKVILSLQGGRVIKMPRVLTVRPTLDTPPGLKWTGTSFRITRPAELGLGHMLGQTRANSAKINCTYAECTHLHPVPPCSNLLETWHLGLVFFSQRMLYEITQKIYNLLIFMYFNQPSTVFYFRSEKYRTR